MKKYKTIKLRSISKYGNDKDIEELLNREYKNGYVLVSIVSEELAYRKVINSDNIKKNYIHLLIFKSIRQ